MVNKRLSLSKNPLVHQPGVFYLRIILPVLLLTLSLPVVAQPSASVKEAKKNFGYVQRGTVVQNIFEVQNTGNQPLLLTEVEISCSCTSAEFPKEPVLPGKIATVTVSFDTKTVYGRQDRVVLLHSNDPSGPVKLRYKGTVSNK